MTEEYLHYSWKHKRFDQQDLRTTHQQELQLKAMGFANSNAGPDFLFAQIHLNGMLLFGHIEIHIKSSDWYAHGHQNDLAYEPVILHIVYTADRAVFRMDGSEIPQLELKNRLNELSFERYTRLLENKKWIPCENFVNEWPKEKARLWLYRLAIDRFEKKWQQQYRRLEEGESFHQIAWELLSRSFGMKVNAEAFLALAKKISWRYVLETANRSALSLEALFFGTAGLLPNAEESNSHIKKLKVEWTFLQSKWNIEPMIVLEWRFSRMRPANFPTLRLAQMASLIHSHPECIKSPGDALKWKPFSEWYQTNGWKGHFHLGTLLEFKKALLPSSSFLVHLEINVFYPLQFSWHSWQGNEAYAEELLDALEHLPKEDNSITRKFKALGLQLSNAIESQACLQLYTEFCQHKRCLQCSMGQHILER